MTTAVRKPATRMPSPKPSSAAIWSEKCAGASSQPRRSAIARPDRRLLRPQRGVPVHEPARPLVAAGVQPRRRRAALRPPEPGEARTPRSSIHLRRDASRPRSIHHDESTRATPAASAGLATVPAHRRSRQRSSASIARTLSRRRTWRGSPEKVAPRKATRALEGELRADDAGAEGEDVHVVVLDALARRVRVVADGGADAADLVRRHGGADARAADEDPAIRARRRGSRDRGGARNPGSRRSGRSRRRPGPRSSWPRPAASRRPRSSAFSAAPA